MRARLPNGRLSRARIFEDWSIIDSPRPIDEVYMGEEVDIPIPPHLTIYQTRDEVLLLAKGRGMEIDYRIVCGHLYVWRRPAWQCLKLGLKYDAKIDINEIADGDAVKNDTVFDGKKHTRCLKCKLVQFIGNSSVYLCRRCKNPLTVGKREAA